MHTMHLYTNATQYHANINFCADIPFSDKIFHLKQPESCDIVFLVQKPKKDMDMKNMTDYSQLVFVQDAFKFTH